MKAEKRTTTTRGGGEGRGGVGRDHREALRCIAANLVTVVYKSTAPKRQVFDHSGAGGVEDGCGRGGGGVL